MCQGTGEEVHIWIILGLNLEIFMVRKNFLVAHPSKLKLYKINILKVYVVFSDFRSM